MTTLNPRLLSQTLTETAWAHSITAGIGVNRFRHPTFFETPVSWVFPIELGRGVRISSAVSIQPELLHAIKTTCKNQRLQLSYVPSIVALEVRKASPSPLPLTADVLRQIDTPGMGVIGADLYSTAGFIEPIFINLLQPETPHMMFSGTTGAGKSTALRTFLISRCMTTSPRNLTLYGIDLKRLGLIELKDIPHMAKFTSNPTEVLPIVQEVYRILKARINGAEPIDTEVILVIDEMSEVLATEPSLFEPTGELVRLAQLGRELNIHLITTAHKPNSDFNTTFIQQFSVKVTGKLAGSRDASDTLGIPDTGAHLLGRKGELIAVVESEARKMQGYLPDTTYWVSQLEDTWGDQERWVFQEEAQKELLSDELRADIEAVRPIFFQHVTHDRTLKWGAKSRYAEALGGEYAGQYLRRVDSLIEYFLPNLQ